MISPRAPRDGDRSRTAALPSGCRAIGAQLAAARETRQLSVDHVASQLLLSKGQVLGLEHADPSAFYNTAFFIRGLRKYMAAMQVPADLLVEDGEDDEPDGLRLFLADTAPTGADSPGRRLNLVSAGAAMAVVAMAATGMYLNRSAWLPDAGGDGHETVVLESASPLPAQPIQRSAVDTPFVRAEPAAVIGTSGDHRATVRVTVGKATWVFIRYPDNRVIERRLEAGEELEVGPLPLYLAVGTAESVELQVENRPIALGPYIRDGQVQITRPELAKLVP
jgi:cytoskeletal protein RodZ